MSPFFIEPKEELKKITDIFFKDLVDQPFKFGKKYYKLTKETMTIKDPKEVLSKFKDLFGIYINYEYNIKKDVKEKLEYHMPLENVNFDINTLFKLEEVMQYRYRENNVTINVKGIYEIKERTYRKTHKRLVTDSSCQAQLVKGIVTKNVGYIYYKSYKYINHYDLDFCIANIMDYLNAYKEKEIYCLETYNKETKEFMSRFTPIFSVESLYYAIMREYKYLTPEEKDKNDLVSDIPLKFFRTLMYNEERGQMSIVNKRGLGLCSKPIKKLRNRLKQKDSKRLKQE